MRQSNSHIFKSLKFLMETDPKKVVISEHIENKLVQTDLFTRIRIWMTYQS